MVLFLTRKMYLFMYLLYLCIYSSIHVFFVEMYLFMYLLVRRYLSCGSISYQQHTLLQWPSVLVLVSSTLADASWN